METEILLRKVSSKKVERHMFFPVNERNWKKPISYGAEKIGFSHGKNAPWKKLPTGPILNAIKLTIWEKGDI